MKRGSLVAFLMAAAAAVAACSTAPPSPTRGARVQAVAAENFWGSIASQLGGTRASVTSIITNPNTDPHDYEPTVADARAISTAGFVLYNGIGYDTWMDRILAASPNPDRLVINVGDLVRVPPGCNPHQWYSPGSVHEVIARTTEDYKKLDPAHAAYFDERRRHFETVSLAEYDSLIARIRGRYAGTPIGASESIVTPLAEALGLDLLTPASFLNAISEGTGPTAADKATADAQIRSKRIKVFIYNRQNSTPDVTALVSEAKAAGIPVVTITETLEPADATFQDWQTAQLRAIEQALKQATGR